MPIQFRCQHCEQPIEVDDEYAGKTAACPYCQHVNSIPQSSTYIPTEAVTARPLHEPAPPWQPQQQPGPPPVETQHSRTAILSGNFALICTALTLVLFAIALVRGAQLMSQAGMLNAFTPASQPSPEDLQQLQNLMISDAFYIGPMIGSMFFAVAGTALAITSLVQRRAGNWRGIVGVVICGGFLLCVCGSGLLQAAGLVGL